MRQAIKTTLILAGLVAAGAGGFWGARLTGPATATTEPAVTEPAAETVAVPVETASVRAGHIEEMATAYGVVQGRPAAAVAISAAFESVTKAVHVAVGDTVSADTPLVDLEPSPEARLQLRQAEEAAAAADRAAEQARRRRDENLATNADVAAVEQAQQAARTQLEAQKARGGGSASTLKAGVAGVVTTLSTQPGQINPVGTAVVVVAPQASVEVRVGIEPIDARTLAAGSAVRLRNSAGAAEAPPVIGTVRQVSGTLNPQTRLNDVFIGLPADARWVPGTFIEAAYARRTADGLIVPRSATTFDSGAWTVFVVRDGKAVKHSVTLGLTADDDTQIIGDGVAAGDVVVTVRNGELEDGTTVEVAAPPSSAAASPASAPAAGGEK